MGVKINLLASLQRFAEGQQGIEVVGKTVEECLKDLTEKYPDLKFTLFDAEGRLRGYIEIYVNGINIYPETLQKGVDDSDEIFLSIAIGGG